jgi:outer membrane lipoprotein-sorting protein
MRLALLDTLGETDLIRNGRDLWTWSSRENAATHQTLPEGQAAPPSLAVPGMAPDQVARLALAAIEPSTEVTVDGSARVAGRDAYELVLRPRDSASLIGSVRLAIDATEHLPLRVLVHARGAESPAIDVSFQQVSFARPDPDQFVFNPPPGAKVEEVDRERAADPAEPSAPTKPGQPGEPGKDEAGRNFASVGSGWTRVLVLRAPTGEDGVPAELDALLQNLPRLGNGRVVKGTLFSVLITDDGRILVGAVTPDRLVRAAADPAAKLPPRKLAD